MPTPTQPVPTRVTLLALDAQPVNVSAAHPGPGSDPQATRPGVVDRLVLTPLVDILRFGCTPRRLAWSISIGIVIGINPLLGSTTVIALVAAFLLRLNIVASQLAAHLCYPLEIILFFAFIRVGNLIFHTGHMPLRREALIFAVRHHPWDTTRLLWTWEWHALLIWAALGLILAPAGATLLLPILTRLREPAQPAPASA